MSISFHKDDELYISLENFVEIESLFNWRPPPLALPGMAYFLARMSQIGYGHGGRKVFWGI